MITDAVIHLYNLQLQQNDAVQLQDVVKLRTACKVVQQMCRLR